MFAAMCATVVLYVGNDQDSYIIRNRAGIWKSITLFNLSNHYMKCQTIYLNYVSN